jgi:alpha-tubulin suppressor-like RCC1 family protein
MGDHLPAVDLGAGETAAAIAVGDEHTCALLSDGSVKCWGHNDYGTLGLGDTSWRGHSPETMGDNLPAVDLGAGETASAIAAGSRHTCALLSSGGVKCWGFNNFGQLGLGDTISRGDGAGEMGDDLPVVDLGEPAVALSLGTYHSCALLIGGGVKCWGNNDFGQLGLGDTASRGDDANEMGNSLPAVDVSTGWNAVSIAAGSRHTCALLIDGSVKCWGNNDFGQLGLGDTDSRGDDVYEMGDYLSPVFLGAGRSSTGITTKGEHSCTLLTDGSVRCWGYNHFGQLGLGDSTQRGDHADELGDNLPSVKLFSDVW